MQATHVQGEQFVGKTLGDYQLEQLVEQGACRAVYKAQKRGQQRSVLLTIFFLPSTFSAQARQLFKTRLYQEGTALIKLEHPHILSLLDIGEHAGYLYQVAPFVPGISLVQLRKRQGRLTPQQALSMLKPVAAALDYAHQQGMVHGALSASNVVLDKEQGLRLVGFGSNRIIVAKGIIDSVQPDLHLRDIAGEPLAGLEYIAPEVVQGVPADARADVYAAGILLFELLCGTVPFGGAQPLQTAQQHVRQTVPAPSTLRSELPVALDLIVEQAVMRDPLKRMQSVGQVSRSFERVVSIVTEAATMSSPGRSTWNVAATLPPTVDWATEEKAPAKSWQLSPPVTGSQMAMPANQAMSMQSKVQLAEEMDPFMLWTGTSSAQLEVPKVAGKVKAGKGTQARKQRQQVPRKDRRQVIATVAIGGVLAGVLGIGGVSLAHVMQGKKLASLADNHVVKPVATQPGQTSAHTGAPNSGVKSQATTAPAPTSAAQAQPTVAQQPVPTAPAVAPPQTNGTVIGSTAPDMNTSKYFTNPIDGMGAILVHLPNGNFVAYSKACTHQGVTVYYDNASNRLMCPAHGAIFDPVNNAKVLAGPAPSPLKAVPIHINGDGTITV